jgi:hypothetical protein
MNCCRNPNEYEMVRIRMMWQAFSIQRGPVEKMKEVITCGVDDT